MTRERNVRWLKGTQNKGGKGKTKPSESQGSQAPFQKETASQAQACEEKGIRKCLVTLGERGEEEIRAGSEAGKCRGNDEMAGGV